jgi:hypothetical protein
MTPLVLSVVAALANPLALIHPHNSGDLRTSSTRVQGWRIDLRRDTFANTSSCRLQRGAMTLERGVMVFHFPARVETAEADLRIDGGPPVKAGDMALEVAGRGVALGGENLRHPGEGRVAVPLRLLRTAHVVAIRPNPRRNHRAFDLGGLAAALEASQREGCDPQPDRPPAA